MKTCLYLPKASQHGAALITSLLILFVLSLLAVSSLQNGIFQERMASATRDSRVAIEGAEAAVMAAENYLYEINAPSDFDGNSNGLFPKNDDSIPSYEDLLSGEIWQESSEVTLAVNYDSLPSEIKVQYQNSLRFAPRYFIEDMEQISVDTADSSGDVNSAGSSYSPDNSGGIAMRAFRIVAWSGGGSGQTPRVIETYFFRDF